MPITKDIHKIYKPILDTWHKERDEMRQYIVDSKNYEKQTAELRMRGDANLMAYRKASDSGDEDEMARLKLELNKLGEEINTFKDKNKGKHLSADMIGQIKERIREIDANMTPLQLAHNRYFVETKT